MRLYFKNLNHTTVETVDLTTTLKDDGAKNGKKKVIDSKNSNIMNNFFANSLKSSAKEENKGFKNLEIKLKI